MDWQCGYMHASVLFKSSETPLVLCPSLHVLGRILHECFGISLCTLNN